MSQPRTESIDEVAEREVSVDKVLVVLLDILGQIRHQRGVNLLELSQRIATVVEDGFVTVLPPFQFGELTRSLISTDLRGLSGQLKLLSLHLQHLTLELEILILKVHQQVQQGDRVGQARSNGRILTGRRDFHSVGPRWR